ncbi:FCH-domain-containing protein [Ascodesmis nigricans]|uniref:Protein BZZ1 n=1 Tax=Ascodesmis nigricans TaxID=341454 RepID=A0A4S2N805_9PEZI|nr:FCH-domain-containing protein [Ascodesmis nigricans]
MTEPVVFGRELKDAFKPVNNWVAAGISWLEDVQSFYRERSALEKEYAGKLNALAKKYHEKKAKKSATLTVGDSPSLTPGSLESASLTTWTTILTSTEQLASEHDSLSTSLSLQVCDVLKAIQARYDDFRIRHEKLAQKLVTQRDEMYGDLKKSKTEYDNVCKMVEEKRQKIDKSFDASRSKAEKAYRAEQLEMNNIKNSYLLQVNVANHHKKRYFYEDLPEVINSLQDLNETRVTRLNALWTLSSQLETSCYQNSIRLLDTQISEIARNTPTLDSGMFLKHNLVIWNEPADFGFEPSPVWHDNPEMVVDAPSQIYLRNILQKSKRGIEGLKGDVTRRQQEIGNLMAEREKVKLDEAQAQREIDLTRSVIYMQEELLAPASKLLRYEVEVSTIVGVVGDLSRGAQAHTFKSTSFKIPTTCDLCLEKIFGIGASGKGSKCTDCGYTCHAKCEMKVPAECPGVLDKAAKKALKEENKKKAQEAAETNGVELTRSNTISSMSSTHTAKPSLTPGIGSVRMSKSPSISGASIASASSAGGAGGPTSLNATTTTSTSTSAAPRRRIIAPPPERYISPPPVHDSPPGSSSGPAKGTGKMLYPFSGDVSEGQLSVSEHETLTILDDDGAWITARLDSGQEGLVPTSYVERFPATPSYAPPPRHRSPSPVSERARSPPPRETSPPARAARTILAPPMLSKAFSKRGPPPPVKPRGAAKKEPRVKALYEYTPAEDGEVEMKVGETFVVLERDVGGWVRVRTEDGCEGLVPGTYVADV